MLKNIFFVGCLMTTAMFSCKKGTHIDVMGDPEVKFFTHIETPANVLANSYSHTVINSPNPAGNGLANVSHNFPSAIRFPVRASKAVAEDVVITAEVDNTLVGKFNQENNTEYEPFPTEIFNLENLSVTIPGGESRSADSIVITPDPSKLSLLTGTQYMTAIRLKSVSKPTVGAITGNEKISIVYITSTVELRKIWYNGTASSITGTLISPRTSWTASYDPTPTAMGGGNIFSGTTGSYQRWANGTGGGMLTVDMQSVRNISALRLYTSNNSNYTPTQIDVYLSADGVNYELMGSPLRANLNYSSSYTYIVFYKPVPAQYVRLRLYYSTSSNSQNLRVTEFDAYATN